MKKALGRFDPMEKPKMQPIDKCCEQMDCKEKGMICIPDSDASRIVVVGGGFAGYNLVRSLSGAGFQVVLIDRNNYHAFLPLLYQVATGGIEPDSVVFPFRKLLWHYSDIHYRMAEVLSVHSDSNILLTSIGAIEYDYLVLAMGSKTNFFKNEGFEKHGFGLKSMNDALDLRSKCLQSLENAVQTCSEQEKRSYSTFVIVGGGPTGVEMAGALAEFKRFILPKDYPELRYIGMRIILVESLDRLLPAMPESLGLYTEKKLKKLGVEVILGEKIIHYNGINTQFDSGRVISSATFIWSAGIKGVPIEGLPESSIAKNGRILVNEFSQVNELGNVFAIGDLALMKSEEHPLGFPMVAQPAIQQGKQLSANLIRIDRKKQPKPFRYRDKGSLATIGRKKAVAMIMGKLFKGYFAWLIWSLVHLMSLLGVRNKLQIALNWWWSYFNYEKADRVIIRKIGEPDYPSQENKKKVLMTDFSHN